MFLKPVLLRQWMIRNDRILLLYSSILFGIAYGLSHQRGLVQMPSWYAGHVHEVCFFLMAWTSLKVLLQ